MNIIYYIKKLFNKNDINQITYYGNIITIPGRNKYNNNEHMPNNIDYYKNQFTTLLSNNKINFSGDLNIDKLEEDIIMHTDLLLHLIMKDENDKELFFDTETKTDKECNNIIKIEKLKIYFAKCFELFNLLIAEINALEEIKDEHIFKYIRSKKAIDEKLNQLKVSYANYFFQFNAINIEMNACINKMDIRNINDEEFNKKVTERFDYLSNYFKKINININNREITKNNIANMEYTLEKWTYQNGNELNKIYEEISNIHDRFIPKNFDALLEEIEQIQAKMFIFDEYSRNKIDESKLYELFKLKFDIYTYYINDDNIGSIFEKENTKEYEYYKKIIMNLITGLEKNPLIDSYFDYDKNKAIKYIRNYLKNSNDIFDSEEILENDLKLKLICTFNPVYPRNQLYSFFQNSYFSRYSIRKKIDVNLENVLLISDKFKILLGTPLSSLFEYFDSSYWDMFQNSKYLYSLYKLKLKRTNHNGVYHLPKNYNNIRSHFINNLTDTIFNILINENFARNYEIIHEFDGSYTWKNIIDNSRQKTLILPNDITRWNYPINFDIPFDIIVLNEGIKTINPQVIPKSVKMLNIPSTLENFVSSTFEKSLWSNIEKITFDNFEDSKILFNKSKLKEFLELIIQDKIKELEILDERVEYVYENDRYERLFDLDLSKIVIGYLKLNMPKLTFNPSWAMPKGQTVLDNGLYNYIRNEYISKVADSIQEQVRYYKKYNISKNRSR